MSSPLRIGIMGSRGIPNAYGGFEQFAEYLSRGLVQRGHEVWVYQSHQHPYEAAEWEGVHLVRVNDPEATLGTAGQFLYDLNSIRDARKRNFHILYHLGYTSDSVWAGLWPRKAVNVVNMDGLEWKRSKYSGPVQRFLKWAEKQAAVRADALVADSTGIRDYLQQTYGKASEFLPYGADVPERQPASVLQPLGLEPNGYHLLIARMEPENHVEEIIRAHLAVPNAPKLVLVGSLKTPLGQRLHQFIGSEQLQFLGSLYDKPLLDALRQHAALYLHGHSVGGTNPSLLEAMAAGALIAAHDNRFNRAILGEQAAWFSDADSLAKLLQSDWVQQHQHLREAGRQCIAEAYTWDSIIDQYEHYFQRLA